MFLKAGSLFPPPPRDQLKAAASVSVLLRGPEERELRCCEIIHPIYIRYNALLGATFGAAEYHEHVRYASIPLETALVTVLGVVNVLNVLRAGARCRGGPGVAVTRRESSPRIIKRTLSPGYEASLLQLSRTVRVHASRVDNKA